MEPMKQPPTNSSWFKDKWQQKLSALFIAIFIWFGVSHSIIATKTIPNIPIRITNVPAGKAIPGMLPNGFYSKRTTLTLTGNKSVIENLEPGELEVTLDASQKPDEWVVQISKKNLISLNPDIDLSSKVTTISQPDLVINMSRLVTEEIPITVETPTGGPPKGYHFLDIWPRKLVQKVSGPEEEIKELMKEGLELEFDLSSITKEELDNLSAHSTGGQDDELTFLVPHSWKYLEIPYVPQTVQMLNDPQAEYLRIDFLKESLIPLEQNLPIMVFYPLDTSSRVNPISTPLKSDHLVSEKDSIPYLNVPLYVSGASRRFIDVVRPYLSIAINARPPRGLDRLFWNVQAVNPKALEDRYVVLMMSEEDNRSPAQRVEKQREKILRTRFREYLQNIRLYIGKERKLNLQCNIKNDSIELSTDDP